MRPFPFLFAYFFASVSYAVVELENMRVLALRNGCHQSPKSSE
jgi:hypothetical protein